MAAAGKSEFSCTIDNLHVVASVVHTGEHSPYVKVKMRKGRRKIPTKQFADDDMRSGQIDMSIIPNSDVVVGVLGWLQALMLGFGMSEVLVKSLRAQDVDDLSRIFPSLGQAEDLKGKMHMIWENGVGINFTHFGERKTVNMPFVE